MAIRHYVKLRRSLGQSSFAAIRSALAMLGMLGVPELQPGGGRSARRSNARRSVARPTGGGGSQRERTLCETGRRRIRLEQSTVQTRIGFDHYTIAHRGLTALQTLEFAQGHHFDGVQFLEPAAIDPRLDRGRLSEFRRRAEVMGLYLEVGLPSPNPVRRSRELGRVVEAAELALELVPHVEAVAAISCRQARVYIGDRHDRFRSESPWPMQIEATIDVIERLTPRLKDLGIRLAIENHADLTGDELMVILDRLDPEIAAVTLDTGNMLMRLDDPVELAARLAPRVVATHIKDAVLAFTPRGLCWQRGRSGRAYCRCRTSWPK